MNSSQLRVIHFHSQNKQLYSLLQKENSNLHCVIQTTERVSTCIVPITAFNFINYPLIDPQHPINNLQDKVFALFSLPTPRFGLRPIRVILHLLPMKVICLTRSDIVVLFFIWTNNKPEIILNCYYQDLDDLTLYLSIRQTKFKFRLSLLSTKYFENCSIATSTSMLN